MINECKTIVKYKKKATLDMVTDSSYNGVDMNVMLINGSSMENHTGLIKHTIN